LCFMLSGCCGHYKKTSILWRPKSVTNAQNPSQSHNFVTAKICQENARGKVCDSPGRHKLSDDTLWWPRLSQNVKGSFSECHLVTA
jgi:hypothetical protein